MHNTVTGGVFFHAVIQGRDITVQLPPQVTPALAGLPAPSAAFAGRAAELEQVLSVLAPRSREEQGKPVRRVVAVSGLAGIGKTELVLQAAARALREPGWFPGGVLFADLHGYAPDRTTPRGHVLDGLLRALGMPGEHIPDGTADRSRLYRSVLAAHAEEGRGVLVVLDNAGSAEQVRPLLPGDNTTAVLVTSRHTLDIGACLHDVPALEPTASVDVLRVRTLLPAPLARPGARSATAASDPRPGPVHGERRTAGRRGRRGG